MPAAPQANTTAVNPLVEREPEVVGQMKAFREQVADMLLNKLAGQLLGDSGFRAQQCPHTLEDIVAAAQVLHVLTKPSWDRDDLRVFDAYWRTATISELFGGEFEAERFRIEHSIEAAGRVLQGKEPFLF